MTDGAALLEAIRANPNEDTPRLAFADWLDEFGASAADRARAAFIRLQIERATIGERRRAPLAARARQLDEESGALLARFRDEWLSAVPPAARTRSSPFLFSRGFLYIVRVDAATIPVRSPGPWDREPAGYVMLLGTAEALWAAFARPWMMGISALDVSVGQQPGVAERLAEFVVAAPFCSLLRSLSLTHWYLPDEALRTLAAAPTLPLVRALKLAGEFSSAGWASLLNSDLSAQLEELTLGAWASPGQPDRRRIGPEAAPILASAPGLGNLRTLTLIADRFGIDGLRTVLASEHLGGLRQLALIHDSLDARGRERFGPDGLPALERLDLVSCRLTPDTIRELAAGGLLGRLKHLNLQINDIPAEAVPALLSGAGGPLRVEVLELGFTAVGDNGVAALAATDRLPALRELALPQTTVTDAGAEALLRAPWADQLERLDLYGNTFSTEMEDRLRERFGDVITLQPPGLTAAPRPR